MQSVNIHQAKRRSELKRFVIKDALIKLFTSKFLFFVLQSTVLLIFIICVDIIAIHASSTHYSLLLLLFPLIYFVMYYKPMIFDMLVTMNHIEEAMGVSDWISAVDQNLFLGGILLEHHESKILKELKIGAVLSINEDYELQTCTAVGRPLSLAVYTVHQITHMQLSTPDFIPPSYEIISAGADFINTHISNNKRVYCHCKSGRGRSACVVLAYLMKYRCMDIHTAYVTLKTARPQIFKRKSTLMQYMIEYARNDSASYG